MKISLKLLFTQHFTAQGAVKECFEYGLLLLAYTTGQGSCTNKR